MKHLDSYVLGVDGGGTSTRAVAFSLGGEVLGVGVSGGSNPNFISRKKVVPVLAEVINSACGKASEKGLTCAGAVLGIAGAGRGKFGFKLSEIVPSLLGSPPVMLESDAYIALRGALLGKPGVIVIAGTGSIAFGIDERGERRAAGGWGPMFGDEGSAYDLARKGITACLRAYDGRGDKTIMTKVLLEQTKCGSLEVATEALHRQSERAEIAQLCSIVFEAASCGDKVARGVVRQAVAELVLSVEAVLADLSFPENSPKVALSGGVFQNSWLRESFERQLKERLPGVEIVDPYLPPVAGAVMEALQMARVGVDEPALENLKKLWNIYRANNAPLKGGKQKDESTGDIS